MTYRRFEGCSCCMLHAAAVAGAATACRPRCCCSCRLPLLPPPGARGPRSDSRPLPTPPPSPPPPPPAPAPPQVSQPLVPLVDEFAARLFAELDYVQEGKSAEKFAKLYRCGRPLGWTRCPCLLDGCEGLGLKAIHLRNPAVMILSAFPQPRAARARAHHQVGSHQPAGHHHGVDRWHQTDGRERCVDACMALAPWQRPRPFAAALRGSQRPQDGHGRGCRGVRWGRWTARGSERCCSLPDV